MPHPTWPATASGRTKIAATLGRRLAALIQHKARRHRPPCFPTPPPAISKLHGRRHGTAKVTIPAYKTLPMDTTRIRHRRTDRHRQQCKTVDKPVHNPVNNPVDCALRYQHNAHTGMAGMDINRIIKGISASFQHFSGRKRYKLINFAPCWSIVDKQPIALSISAKQSTACVGNQNPRVDNGICKRRHGKFSTYQQHIIQHISIFKEKKKRIIILMRW